jgi:hypothetical protein
MAMDRRFTLLGVLIGVVLGNAVLFQAWGIAVVALIVAAIFVFAFGPKRWVVVPEDQEG